MIEFIFGEAKGTSVAKEGRVIVRRSAPRSACVSPGCFSVLRAIFDSFSFSFHSCPDAADLNYKYQISEEVRVTFTACIFSPYHITSKLLQGHMAQSTHYGSSPN